MKRSLGLIALAAVASTSALAQSNVTLYGRINTTVENQKAGTASAVTVLANNSSRWGLKGSEDLGGGLKAGFALESGFASDTGTSSQAGKIFGRRAEVNLSGGFGTVRMGTYNETAFDFTDDYTDNHNHGTGSSANAFWGGFGRLNNAVGYISPSLGGVTLYANVQLKETKAAGAKDIIDIAADYAAGNFGLGAGYVKRGDGNLVAVRANYAVGGFGIAGYVASDEDLSYAKKATQVRLSASYTVGASEFHVNVGQIGKRKDVADSKATQATIGYNHNLSKRTKAYAFVTKVDDGKAAVYGGDFRSVGLGIRHNF
ncbi:MAG: porin [Burkholderiales bacterium]